MKHPPEQDLALYATNDQSFVKRWLLARHLQACGVCAEVVEEYRELTLALGHEPDLPEWDSLAAEMRANVRLGLEAGACIAAPRDTRLPLSPFNPRLAVAFASLVVLVGAGVLLRQPEPSPEPTVVASQQIVHVDPEGVTITNVFGE